jgi:NAD-dependent deacetylase
MKNDVAGTAAEWIGEARKIVVLTGYELSAECGLSDFTDARLNPQIRDFRESRDVRAGYWKKIMEIYPSLVDAEPGPGHRALAELEMLGNLDCIFTQSTDGLHRKAGNTTVIELNSSILWITCPSCGKDYSIEEIAGMLDKSAPVPVCRECGSDQLKPAISFPGQPPPHWEAREAWMRLHSADLFLIAGASLENEPVASYPFLAKENNARVVVISEKEGPADDYVDAVIYGKPGQVLSYIIKKVKEGITIS